MPRCAALPGARAPSVTGFAQETTDSNSGDFLAHSTPTGDGLGEETGPSYSGDFLTRSTLTGDWLGVRNALAAKGISLDANVTQIEQGVVNGGKNGSWEYGILAG